jgi:hypothetical protein
MAFSLLRSLLAVSRLNIITIKRQAKRLKNATPDVFGQTFPLSVCQEAMARANGFQHWHEAQQVLSRVGADRNSPWWTIKSRNDTHQATLCALVTLELELLRDGALVMLGQAANGALPALGLLLEEMSFSKKPGLILVETDHPAMQDTSLWPAVLELGQEDLLADFRSVDLREPRLPVAIDAEPENWLRALAGVLPDPKREEWLGTGEASILKDLIGHYAELRRMEVCDLYPVKQAMAVIMNPKMLVGSVVSRMTGDARTSMKMDCERYLADSPSPCAQNVMKAVEQLDGRYHRTGPILHHESKRRPVIALFSRDDPASVILAGAVHSMFYWRWPSDETCPILYFADKTVDGPPAFLRGAASRALIVPGTPDRSWSWWHEAGWHSSMFASIGTDRTITAAGRRCKIETVAG